ncbi:MAG TPA: HAMP domain-containing sensor histidine kinase [Pseudonocardiaceae bacterium]|nr:HAMP domain-containing sensor histidine kinase [Pseudonocardiaceae bacterium]
MTTALRTTSLRRRVTVLVIVVLAVVLLGIVLAVNAVFAAETNRDLTAVLADHGRVAVTLARQNVGPKVLLNRVDTDGVRAEIVLVNGQTYGGLPSPSDNVKQATIRLVSRGVLNGARLTLAVATSAIQQAQAQLRGVLLLVGLVALAVTGIVLVVAIRVALKPLAVMTGLARSIAGGGRGRRLSPTDPDTELGRTAAAFDDMLDALEGAEHQARVAEAASRASEERTRRFVADAAHELRTPIAGVQAAAEAVLQQSPEAGQEERDRMHLLLVRESRRAGQLVNDLLDLARIDAGVELTIAPVNLRALADAQAERIRVLAPELTVRVDGPALTVWADEARITQIVANLLDNARKATGPDGHVGVWLRQVATFAELLVTDDGPGVPEAQRDRIFDRLVRLDNARDRRFGGSGLGLPIARGFARAHGGDLACVAPPPADRGAVFRLVLPIRIDPAAATERITRFATGPLPATGPGPSELSGRPETWQS